MTEEEEDEEYLKEEEAGTANTRLVTQPSCEFCLCGFTSKFLCQSNLCGHIGTIMEVP